MGIIGRTGANRPISGEPEQSEAGRLLFQVIGAIAPVPQTEQARLLSLLQPRALAKGDYFVRAGERTRTIGFAQRGLLRHYYISADGRDFTRAFHQEGQFVASMTAFLSGEPSYYFIQALEETVLLTLECDDWACLQDSHPVWAGINKRILEGAVLRGERREQSLILDDAQTRYLDFLREFPGIESRVKQHYIASYLGITPVFLSKIRGRPAKK